MRCKLWKGIYTVAGKKEVCRTWRFVVIRDTETGEEKLIMKEPYLSAAIVTRVLQEEAPKVFWELPE